ncbi:conserved hypothetical protein [Leishmania major strain Friedlin]|uniref:Uncharacterized protein n=1 Tax=Leishmania major TaxID=5664 RepID=Q4QGV0_LEIMA|nr:conserved hypothetical protein [Leishmania major strain Friedlin]CAG9570323.1 hypothetical_protein_-_conserved [Leishmania major strain Friedlin]CAJ03052.1 conserved hypothetical protein [Leishmania major strain Friedlin]|eukprot:XP_001681598.1 conserved hypothetical protein [Leishmania major strain Friedlin]
MASKAGGVAPKAQAGASSLAAHEPLIIAAAFLDGVVAVSGVPVMMAQAAYVSFPSGAYLVAYQLCFLVPQLIATLVAEQLTLHVSASALLLFTLMCSTGSAAIVALSLSQRALSLFFASHILNGVFRHTKILFGVTAEALHMSTTDVSAAARYGMMAGMLLSGIAGDIMRDAVQVAQLFIGVEAVAATLVFAHLLLRSRTVVVTARASQEYAQWLPSLTRAPAAVYRTVSALIAVMLAASVNQMVYPIAAPAYGLPYTFAGAHLCFSLVLQMVLMPSVVEVVKRMARQWRSNVLLTGSAEDKLSVIAGLLLLAGCTVVPCASDFGPLAFYPTSLLLVDLPAGVLTTLAASAVQETFGHGSGDAPKVARLLTHITQLVKMFAAPLRICTAESLRGYKYPVHCISIPLMTYVLVNARTQNVAYAAAGLATTLLLLTSTVSSFEGEL